MDHLSSGGPFDGLTSFFSRRSRPTPPRPHVLPYAELAAPTRETAETAESHRAIAIEQTEAAISHFLELTRRLATALRRHEIYQRATDESGHYGRSRLAQEESLAWARWVGVIQAGVRDAEDGVIAAVRAWEAARGPSDVPGRGVIHQGKLFLVGPAKDGDRAQLLMIDLKASLNLDRSLTVVELVR